jgi:2-methylcitrate dehydratase PrpD
MTSGAELARFALRDLSDHEAADVRKAAIAAIVDGLASVVGGTREDFGRLLHRRVAAYASTSGSSIAGSSVRVPAELAAYVNAAAGHSLCYDDTSNAMMGHPTIVVLPSVLALGEALESSGAEVLDAYAIGVEVAVRTSEVLAPGHYQRGWHATGVCGVLGAAAAAARLLHLDQDATERALGVAATSAAGLRANFGSMAMIFHAGLAARSGVEAALLARLGMTTAADPFGGPMGYFSMFAADDEIATRVAALPDRLGRPWELVEPGLDVKPFPCGSLAHRAIQGVLELRAEHGFTADDIVRLICRLPELHRGVLVHREPHGVLEARISLVYPVAVAAVRGSCGVDDFTLELLASTPVQRLMKLIEIQPLEVGPVTSGADLFAAPAEVSVDIGNGTTYTRRVVDVLASPAYPFTPEQVRAKFDDCTVRVLGPATSQALWEAAWRFDRLPRVQDLTAYMRPG